MNYTRAFLDLRRQNEDNNITEIQSSGTYRDVGLSLCAVESELQRRVPVEEGKEAFGPEGGDEIFILEPPVEAEHSVEVQSQTATVVHQHTQLLSLEKK